MLLELNGHRTDLIRTSLYALRSLDIQLTGENSHILVTASREIDYQYVMRRHGRCNPHAFSDRVSAFECRENAFCPSESNDRFEHMGIVRRDILGATTIVQRRMFWADGGVIQTGGHRMSQRHLPIFILQNIGICALQNAGNSALKARGVIAERLAPSTGF